MDIAWLGHAAFRLRGRDAAIVTDPCPGSTGFRLNRPQADLLTVSNPGPAFAWIEGVAGSPRPLEAPGEYEVKHILVTGVATPGANGPRSNTAFVITLDDVIVAHLGDLRGEPNPAAMEELSRAQVVLIPVGNRDHFSPRQAAGLVGQLDPQLIIPMLYKTGPETEDLEEIKPFLDAVSASVNELDENHLNVTPSSLPEKPTVQVLQPRGG